MLWCGVGCRHGFPFNSELELYDQSLLSFGIALTHDLDAQFGLPPKRTISQRDVPGTTRSIIPQLLSNGISALSIGVNGGSMPPAVPSAWVWELQPNQTQPFESLLDPSAASASAASKSADPQRIIGMLHPGGYGGCAVLLRSLCVASSHLFVLYVCGLLLFADGQAVSTSPIA